MILVTGATGNTGTPLVTALRAAGAPVRTAARHGADIRFDWADPATYAPALAGTDRVYLVAPVAVVEPESLVDPFLRAADAAGVRRVVLLSSSAIEAGEPGLGRLHELVRDRCPEWTVLRPSWFMQNLVGAHPAAEGARATGEIVTATGDGRVAFVDAADIAAVAAAALLDPVPHDTDHVITGPRALSYAEAATLLGEAIGRPVTHVSVTAGDLAARLTRAGYPTGFAAFLAALDTGIAAGSEDRVTDTVARVAGRPPRDLTEFLTAHATEAAAR